ncbi:hypothetical protein Q1M64_00545 (plasmid) [Sinorhizobium meliloti]|nr:hypothetical protein Q1M64_00545 [Sinorhizobium meliloti]
MEFYRLWQRARLDEATLNFDKYFSATMWPDLANAISMMFSGTKEPTGGSIDKHLEKERKYIYPVDVPAGKCRYVIVIAQPPSEAVVAMAHSPEPEIQTQDRSFYKWMEICNTDAQAQRYKLEVALIKSGGLARVFTYKDRDAAVITSATNKEEQPRITFAVCLGQYSGNCPDKADVFYGCGAVWGNEMAAIECRKRGYPDGKSLFNQRITVGGNKCGYSIADVTCG